MGDVGRGRDLKRRQFLTVEEPRIGAGKNQARNDLNLGGSLPNNQVG